MEYIGRLAKIENALREVKEHGMGKVEIHLGEDHWLLTVSKEHEDPTIYAIQDMLRSVSEWGLGGIAVREGETKCYIETRRERI